MSDSSTAGGSTTAQPQGLAKADAADELELRPIEGLSRWLPGWAARVAMRAASMVEQPLASMEGPLSPVRGYFRRDRHRHPKVNPETYRLRVTGVAEPRELTLADLRDLPWQERVLVMECAGNGNHMMGSAGLIGQARWRGPSLQTILDACGGPGPATHFAFHGLDHIPVIRRGYHYGLSLDELTDARALVALEMNGEPLPRPRGFPTRLVVPGIYSMSHVKWLGHIDGKTAPHEGIHNRWVFTNKELRDGKWVRVQARWIGLKSMITRCRRVGDGWVLTGWAWGGEHPVQRITVTTDGGQSWHDANVHPPETYFGARDGLGEQDIEHAWAVFDYKWRPSGPGRYRLASRAYDTTGHAQPMEDDPNVRGHFNVTRVKWRDVDVPE